jgi:hypothetical protein
MRICQGKDFIEKIVFIFLLFAKKEVIRYTSDIFMILYPMRTTPTQKQNTETSQVLAPLEYIQSSVAVLTEKYADSAMTLAMLSSIVAKAEQVPSSVQATVAELLRANLEAHMSNMSTITAVVMAMDPKSTIAHQKMMTHMSTPSTEAANDPSVRMVA